MKTKPGHNENVVLSINLTTFSQIAITAALPYYKSLNVSGDMYQSYLIVANLPWSMKAAMGILSDAVPIMGYHKISYILMASILGTAAFAVLGFVQFSHATAAISAFLGFLTQFQIAFVDLLTEGKYAEMMAQNPASGTALVSFAWGLRNVGMFFGSSIGGPMADHFNPRYIFLVCLPLAAQVIIPPAVGWYPDPRLPAGQRGIRHDKLREHPNIFKASILVTLGAFFVGGAALFGSGSTQVVVSLIMTVTLCVLAIRWLPRTICRTSLYLILASMLYVSVNGATDYWFTANEKCVPNGPNFSFTFFNTYASLVSSFAGGIGVVFFQRYLSQGSFRVAFWTTSIVKIIGSLSDIAIVKRLNLRVGIPDTVAFMLGDGVIQNIAMMLDFMPAVVLISKVCPPGMESSVYALLASYQNIGSAAARAIGVGLIDYLGIKTVEPCNFDRLPMAIFLSHIALPLLAFPLVFVLIPASKMTEDIVTEEPGEPGEGGADGFVRVASKEVDVEGAVKEIEAGVEAKVGNLEVGTKLVSSSREDDEIEVSER